MKDPQTAAQRRIEQAIRRERLSHLTWLSGWLVGFATGTVLAMWGSHGL